MCPRSGAKHPRISLWSHEEVPATAPSSSSLILIRPRPVKAPLPQPAGLLLGSHVLLQAGIRLSHWWPQPARRTWYAYLTLPYYTAQGIYPLPRPKHARCCVFLFPCPPGRGYPPSPSPFPSPNLCWSLPPPVAPFDLGASSCFLATATGGLYLSYLPYLTWSVPHALTGSPIPITTFFRHQHHHSLSSLHNTLHPISPTFLYLFVARIPLVIC